MKDNVPRSDEELPNWFERLSRVLLREPKTHAQLVEVLHDAEQRNVLDADSLDMIEGVLDVSAIKVDDIMIPRSQMIVLKEDALVKDVLPSIIESAHSRYPVIDDNFEKVVGVLIVKDLLQYGFSDKYKNLRVKDVLRSVMFVPESRRLDILLREFRAKHIHMGVVLDEYGNVAGLVTIEDVLEQIVGDIEDEHDVEEDKPEIIEQAENQFLVQAQITTDDFNEYFDSDLDHPEFNTVGGVVTNQCGHMPKSGEVVLTDGFQFTVHEAGARRVKSLRVKRLPPQNNDTQSS